MISVAVSGINATDNPGPGIPVAKALRKTARDFNITGLGYSADDPGHYLNQYLDQSTIMPWPTKGWQGIKEKLQSIKDRFGLDILISNLDAELPIYIKHQDEINEMGIATLLPTENQFKMRSKAVLADFCEELQVDHPRTVAVHSIDEMHYALESFCFPVWVKGQYYKAFQAYDYQSAIQNFNKLFGEWGAPVLIQEPVAGEELNVAGLGDGKGGLCGFVSIRKQSITSLGKIWSGVSLRNSHLEAITRRFVEVTKWSGPFELEFKVQGDRICLIEINPRFPAWIYFSAGIGVNLPERLIDLLTKGSCDTAVDYPAGKLYMRYTEEVVTDISEFSKIHNNGESYV